MKKWNDFYKVLSDEQIRKIHNKSVEILERIGAKVHSEKARKIFANNGCKIIGDRVYIPSELTERLCSYKQNDLTIYSRTGKKVVSKKGRIHVHNSGAVSTIIDSKTGESRNATIEDASKLVKVMDSLDSLDAITPIVYPQGVEQDISLIYAIKEIIKNTSKPVHGPGISTIKEAKYIYEMFVVLAGDEKTLREKPMICLACSPLSPLTLPKNDTEAMIWYAKKGIPVAALPCPIAGLTSPMTLLGSLTQQNAEVLLILVLARLINPTAQISYGARLDVANMRFGTTAGGAPEEGIVSACAVQMADYYDVESDVYGAATSSIVADTQMGFEKTSNILLPAMAGSNWLSGLGSICDTITTSYEQLVIDNEIFSYILYTLRTLHDDEENLGYQEIKDVMDGKEEFLMHSNTIKYMRSKELFNRTKSIVNERDYSGWIEDGKKNYVDNAKEKVNKIIKEHEVIPLEREKEIEIEKIYQAARKDILFL